MVDHILKASQERNLIVTIMYLKGSDITMRNIKVLEVKENNIKAYCYLRNESRVFKKENILSAAFLDTTKVKRNELQYI